MSGLNPANEAVLVGVAKVLGLKDVSALAELRPSGLMKLTQRELLDVARALGLTKISRLNKEALLARVWEALENAGAISEVGPATAPAPPTPNGHKNEGTRPQPVEARVDTREQLSARPDLAVGDRVMVPPPEGAQDSPPGAAHKFDVGDREQGQGRGRGGPPAGRGAAGHPLGLRFRSGHRAADRSPASVRLLGDHRRKHEPGADRPGSWWPGRLAGAAGIRRHRPDLRRGQRPQLLRSPPGPR